MQDLNISLKKQSIFFFMLCILIFILNIIINFILKNNIKGIIVAWSGSITNIPTGWAFCDGEKYKLNMFGKAILDRNGTATPDLRSRFIIGAASDNNIYSVPLGNGLSGYYVKKTGGVETVTLSIDQMPSHSHDVINILNQGIGCYGTDCQYTYDPVNKKFKSFPLMAKSGPELLNPNPTELSVEKNTSQYGRPGEIPYYTGFTGGSKPHENMPPYYALAYIIKL
jgi:microcystin-dependent protein